MPRGRLQAAPKRGNERNMQAVQEPVLQGALVSWWVSHAALSAQRRSLTAPAAAAGDHNCMRLSGGISRSASAPQLVPKAVPGVLVSSIAKPKEAQAAPGPQKVRMHCNVGRLCWFLLVPDIQAAAATAGSSSSTTLQQLQSSEPGSLLEGLLAASPSVGLDAQGLLIRALGDDSAEVRHCIPALVNRED
jgi:hypothetical protein